jgi:hypothetical protein
VQVKASDDPAVASNGRCATVRTQRVHLKNWLAQALPVIPIAYDAKNNQAFWLSIHDVFPGVMRFRATRGTESLTLRIPVAQVLNPTRISN